MQLKKWFALALVAVALDVATPIFLLTSSAAATTAALTLSVANPALAVVGGAAVLLGAAALVAAAAAGGRRGKRAVAGTPDDGFSNDAIEILFAAAGSLDAQTNCGLRLVCELAATPEEQLAADEALLLSLFGSQLPIQHDQINSPMTPFQLAFFLGRQSGSVQVCSNTYLKCQHNSNQIMDILRQNQNQITV